MPSTSRWPPPDIEDFMAFADAAGIAGASVTAPFKLDAVRASR
jgi:shikimate 5-dehydrogenase